MRYACDSHDGIDISEYKIPYTIMIKILFIIITLLFFAVLFVQGHGYEVISRHEQRALDHYNKEKYFEAIDAYGMALVVCYELELKHKINEILENKASIHAQIARKCLDDKEYNTAAKNYKQTRQLKPKKCMLYLQHYMNK